MSETIKTALSTAFTSIQTGAIEAIEMALPIGLGIWGLKKLVSIAIGTFSSVAR